MWHVEARLSCTAVDDDTDCGRLSAMSAALLKCFNHAATASDDVFDNQDFLAGFELEVAAQLQLIIDFFEEYKAQTELACDFLANYQTTHSWPDDRGRAIAFEVFDHYFCHPCDFIHVLANLGALKEMGTVQA